MTKELWQEIMGDEFDSLNQYNTDQIMNDSNTMSRSDLAITCIEWAFSLEFNVSAGIIPFGNWLAIAQYKLEGEVHRSKGDSFNEVVTEVCEWILKNKNKDSKDYQLCEGFKTL